MSHSFRVESRLKRADGRDAGLGEPFAALWFRAVCECGFKGLYRDTREQALESGRQHGRREADAARRARS